MRRTPVSAVVVWMISASLLVACSSGTTDDESFTAALPATLAAGESLPTAVEPLLEISVSGERIAQVDIEGIETLGTVEATVFDRWLDRDLPVEGVWIDDLLAAVGAEDTTNVRLHALDDFEIEISMEDFDDHDVLLATRADGKRIPLEDGGPTRLVFLDSDSGGVNGQYWIWNIDAVHVP